MFEKVTVLRIVSLASEMTRDWANAMPKSAQLTSMTLDVARSGAMIHWGGKSGSAALDEVQKFRPDLHLALTAEIRKISEDFQDAFLPLSLSIAFDFVENDNRVFSETIKGFQMISGGVDSRKFSTSPFEGVSQVMDRLSIINLACAPGQNRIYLATEVQEDEPGAIRRHLSSEPIWATSDRMAALKAACYIATKDQLKKIASEDFEDLYPEVQNILKSIQISMPGPNVGEILSMPQNTIGEGEFDVFLGKARELQKACLRLAKTSLKDFTTAFDAVDEGRRQINELLPRFDRDFAKHCPDHLEALNDFLGFYEKLDAAIVRIENGSGRHISKALSDMENKAIALDLHISALMRVKPALEEAPSP